jgi:integrase
MQRRKSGTYEFRKRLPEALAGKPAPAHIREGFSELVNPDNGCFKRELVRSLGTKEEREAKRRDHREALRVSALFDEAMRAQDSDLGPQALTEADIQEIADEWEAELLRDDEAEREEGDDRRHLQTDSERKQWPDLVSLKQTLGMSAEHYFAYGDLIDDLEGDFREAWARRDPSIVFPETNIALKRRGKQVDPSSPDYRKAALKVLEAHVRAYDKINARQRGASVPTPTVDRGPKLSEVFERWKRGGSARGAKKPSARTVLEAEQAVRYFKDLNGDMRLGNVNRETARTFRDTISKIPKALPAKLRKLPLAKLLERDLSSFPMRSATTINKLLTMLGAIISQAERDGFMDKVAGFVNPFGRGMRLQSDESNSRSIFDRADLTALFNSPVFSQGSRPEGGGLEAAFWFPLIGLMSGMRLDEIAQLRICDLRQDEGTSRWLFDVGRTGGRSTKTHSSIRCVPVHRELERIGIVRYRNALLADGVNIEGPLWPGLKKSANRPISAAWSKWFGRYKRNECGISDPSKVFHSFRHTFKRMTRDARLEEELHDALTGQTTGGKEGVGRRYGRGYSISPLVAAMDRVMCPVDLSGIEWCPPGK